jgi:hypothetical protein
MTKHNVRRAGLALALAGCLAAPAAAQEVGCRGELAGTYLTNITTSKGRYASRSLVTIHGDGTLSAVDSRQYHGVMGAAFSAQRGDYRCTGPEAAAGRTLNFGFPKRAAIARSEWTITRNKATGAISGTITLIVYRGVRGVDPFGKGGRKVDTFRFTGVPVGAAK